MTDDECKRLRMMAIGFAQRHGLNDLAEDFAQDYLVEMLKGRKALMKQIFVDFMRKEFGDTRLPTGKARSKALRFPRPIVDEPTEYYSPSKAYVQYCKEYMKNPLERLEEEEDRADRKQFLDKLYKKLGRKKQNWQRGNLAKVLRLRIEGKSQEEIGKIMNLSVAYIPHLFKNIFNIMKQLPKFTQKND